VRRSELRNGLTDRQRLFLFGKLSGLNDKDAAIAAGLFGERSRAHKAEDLEASRPSGI
jgi:hypothetical protein